MDANRTLVARLMRTGFSFCVAWSLIAGGAWAAEPTGQFQRRVFKDDKGEHKYALFVPANYSPARQWPVILFLHSAGERGTDGWKQTSLGLGPYVNARKDTFPFFVVFPQCEDESGRILTAWQPNEPDGRRALQILEQVERDYNIDHKREILTGWSMGGYGAWSMAAAFPERWWAVVPLAGGGDEAAAERMRNVPIWAFHGAKDNAVRASESRKMFEALQKVGAVARYTELPDTNHDLWKSVYDSDALYAWMRSPHSGESGAVTLPPGTHREGAEVVLPFVPALDIPQAVYVRLGNDMLADLADSIPFSIPPGMLQGNLADISSSTSAQGYTFDILFSNITYSARLERAAIKAYQTDRVNVQFGLRDAQILIGSTSVSGSGNKGASAGPISIVIGHQRPVWLSFDVTPVIDQYRLRFKSSAAAFQIPNDNWYVSGPAGVSTSGLGVTSEKVSSGLVSGLYGSKQRIEQQVVAIVPKIIAELERRLELAQANRVIGGFWPLPFYQPRLRAWPSDVTTDPQGVTLVLGVTAATPNPEKPVKRRQAPALGSTARDVRRGTALEVGIDPRILATLSELLVEDGVTHINVLDTPAKSLAQLTDPQIMSDAIPDLKRHAAGLEMSAELVLAGPISVAPAPAGDLAATPVAATNAASEKTGTGGDAPQPPLEIPSSERLLFQVPKLLIKIALRADHKVAHWTPCAEFELSIRQPAQPKLHKPTSQIRTLTLNWEDEVEIKVTGRFAQGYEPVDSTLNVDCLQQMFQTGWREFMHEGPAAEARIPDLNLGYTKLRLQRVDWSARYLAGVFGAPGVNLKNSTAAALVYETKGPFSAWSAPLTLNPGETHRFNIAYPLVFRRHTDHGDQMYTLPAGSRNEFLVPKPGSPPALYQAREPTD